MTALDLGRSALPLHCHHWWQDLPLAFSSLHPGHGEPAVPPEGLLHPSCWGGTGCWCHQNRADVAVGSGRRLLGKLQDSFGSLESPGRSNSCLKVTGSALGAQEGPRGWGLSQTITSITLPLPPKCRGHRAVPAFWASPLLGAGGAGALGGTGWGTEGTWGTLGLPREQPPALRRARCEQGSVCSDTSKPCSSSLPWREKGKTL